MSTDSGEADLVDGLRNGDPQALAALFDRYGDRIYNHCFRATGDLSDPEPDHADRVAEQATETTDGQGRTWWRMLYVCDDGGGNELTKPPITVQVSCSGVQKTYELRWGLDTCAQANHGC